MDVLEQIMSREFTTSTFRFALTHEVKAICRNMNNVFVKGPSSIIGALRTRCLVKLTIIECQEQPIENQV